MRRILPAVALVVAAVPFYSRTAKAYKVNEAPWCAVINLGPGDAYWDCQYATLEACVPHVLTGNRGFCNPSPYYVDPVRPVKKSKSHRRYRVRTN
jgi:hypothetical protein